MLHFFIAVGLTLVAVTIGWLAAASRLNSEPEWHRFNGDRAPF
ncbi:hypothetical protein [Ramlibacter alkalitolerans]|nr:hypothetical protein [Ramlibacter alkalitolerans]